MPDQWENEPEPRWENVRVVDVVQKGERLWTVNMAVHDRNRVVSEGKGRIGVDRYVVVYVRVSSWLLREVSDQGAVKEEGHVRSPNRRSEGVCDDTEDIYGNTCEYMREFGVRAGGYVMGVRTFEGDCSGQELIRTTSVLRNWTEGAVMPSPTQGL